MILTKVIQISTSINNIHQYCHIQWPSVLIRNQGISKHDLLLKFDWHHSKVVLQCFKLKFSLSRPDMLTKFPSLYNLSYFYLPRVNFNWYSPFLVSMGDWVTISFKHWWNLVAWSTVWLQSQIEFNLSINSLWPSDNTWQYRFGLILAQLMACCLIASSHNLNKCWLINRVLWHLQGSNITGSAQEFNPEPE